MPTATTNFASYANNIMESRYSHVVAGRKESWDDIASRVTQTVTNSNYKQCTLNTPSDIKAAIFESIRDRKFIPGGRILSQAGRPYHQTDNCFCLKAVDTREGWADLAHKTTMMFMSGGGVGVSYDDIRGYGTTLGRSGGIASGPIPLVQMVNSIGAAARQGGERRGAIYASLKWDHPDIAEFIKMKEDGQSLKHTNISTRFDTNWHHLMKSPEWYGATQADIAFMSTLRHACKYGDPGFQFDDDNQILRNACCEIISADDGDSCCLGSINLAAISSLQELAEVAGLAVLFLLCNTLYTHTPTQQVAEVKQKNRRIGLGLMGVAEWFIQRQLPYGSTLPTTTMAIWSDPLAQIPLPEFEFWLKTYKGASENAAQIWSDKLSINIPIAVRAIAPTGTISTAIGHTTPGIEPVFHTAYQRTYNTLKSREHADGYVIEKVIDPIVQKWIEKGYDVRDIDTAYTLSQSSEGIERRLAFQAFVQQYVDNAISSTINLPPYKSGIELQIAPILLKYLPKLRGVTFYPDGRYNHQPVVPLDIAEVLSDNNVVTKEHESCKIEGCGA